MQMKTYLIYNPKELWATVLEMITLYLFNTSKNTGSGLRVHAVFPHLYVRKL